MSESNLEIVKNMYAAFARGDISYILDQLDEAVDWKEAENPDIPFSGSFPGKANVPKFFQAIGQSVEVAEFTTSTYVAEGDHVAAFGSWAGRVRSTQKAYKSEWAMHWRFRNGKVIGFQGYVDTAAEAAAHRASAASA